MNIEPLELNGAYYLESEVYEDDRGFFFEWFQKEKFKEQTDIDFGIKQINQSKSKKGVLRGLHYQLNPFAQAKLVSVSKGLVQDVIVDIRKSSSTYGKHFSTILSGEKRNQLYIPKGFAHGFLVLSDEAEFCYAIDSIYSPEHDRGIIYNDGTLNIDWKVDNPTISEKDAQLKSFSEADNNFS